MSTWEDRFAEYAAWDASHEDIIMWVLSMAYGVLALIASVVFCYKLYLVLKEKRNHARDACANQSNTYHTRNALILLPVFFMATTIRSLTSGPLHYRYGYSDSLRSIVMDISVFYFFSIYIYTMNSMWNSYNIRTACGADDDDTSKLRYRRLCLRKGVSVIYDTVSVIQIVIFLCEQQSVLDGVNLCMARLLVVLLFLAAIIWLHVHEFIAYLSSAKESGLEVSPWQAVFSQCEALKTARQAVPMSLKFAILLGVYAFCVKATFMAFSVILCPIEKDIIPFDVDDVTGLSINNFAFYFLSELAPFGYVLFLLSYNFEPHTRQQIYLPVHQSEISASDNGP